VRGEAMNKKDKINRVRSALEHREYDRIPISDFFWTGFIEKAKQKWGLGFDPYRHFDLDYIVVNPNMDPHLKDFEILEKSGDDIVVRTGFEATIRRRSNLPMPHFEDFAIKTPDDMASFEFDDTDIIGRRFARAGDDQLNCLGDAISFGIPSFIDRFNSYKDDFCMFGSVCEMYEYIWRIIGTENALYWMILEPDKLKAFIDRAGAFMQRILEAQIEYFKGSMDGMYIWGDVAYVNGMMFNPDLWRGLFKPWTEKYIRTCKEAGLMVIYHGCGDAREIYGDFIEMGLDGYNPVEAKAHLDITELRKDYKGRLAFVGNIDVRELESGDRERIKREVFRKIKVSGGGGWICQSDHSVSSGVAPDSYAYMVELIKEYGKYPLSFGDLD